MPSCFNSNGVSTCARRRKSLNRWAWRATRMHQSESHGYTPFSLAMIHISYSFLGSGSAHTLPIIGVRKGVFRHFCAQPLIPF
ncbi:hypothetical protein Y032_0113g382 [Ancylostoma ceylanicum]|uniref:Uncharacterized protein n=1 Tax=Ancylostoma ceylanicum TaxID=53326 RepID=A0A016TDL8_9BILA|nr:hypothetical protein Y032_0113g382 [Ancylostoma ceylanicum]